MRSLRPAAGYSGGMGVDNSAATEPTDDMRTGEPEEPRDGPLGVLDRIRSTHAGRLTLKIVIGVIGAALVIGGLALNLLAPRRP